MAAELSETGMSAGSGVGRILRKSGLSGQSRACGGSLKRSAIPGGIRTSITVLSRQGLSQRIRIVRHPPHIGVQRCPIGIHRGFRVGCGLRKSGLRALNPRVAPSFHYRWRSICLTIRIWGSPSLTRCESPPASRIAYAVNFCIMSLMGQTCGLQDLCGG